ncbi:MAG: UDP-2,3-diacylglucosamine diphosphatase [Gammaproteobacteria bacterium]
MHNRILFASDIHLSPSRPELADLFFKFLNGPCQTADALYLLGDIFEGWVGDDDLNPYYESIEQSLWLLNQHGTQIYFMPGNRDFMIGNDFLKRTGCIGLEDPTAIDLFGQTTLLMHGDTLCTLDVKYQRFRKFARHPLTRLVFLNLPLKLRQSIFGGFRNKSKQAVSQKPMHIMDVTPEAVCSTFKQFKVSQIIHGHVHRPLTHLNETPNSKRIVLGDWGKTGSYIEATPLDIRLYELRLM